MACSGAAMVCPLAKMTEFLIPQGHCFVSSDYCKVNTKYQGPEDVAQFHLLLIFENTDGIKM